MPRRQPISTLFPYTTLFRSVELYSSQLAAEGLDPLPGYVEQSDDGQRVQDSGQWPSAEALNLVTGASHYFVSSRSEEHTSELQSHSELVCRLLLERKNGKSP